MYEENNIRGSIKYLKKYKQLISFEGMERMRKITPTDIDGLIDYNGNSFIYMEFKTDGKSIDYGQRLAIEHIINSHEQAGHKACALLIYHNCDADEIIMAKEKIIESVYQNNKWRDWKKANQNLIEFLDYWETWCLSKNVNL